MNRSLFLVLLSWLFAFTAWGGPAYPKASDYQSPESRKLFEKIETGRNKAVCKTPSLGDFGTLPGFGGDLPGLGGITTPTTYKLTINLVYDMEKYTPPYITWLTPDSFTDRQGLYADFQSDKVEIEVSEGTHDFIAQFQRWYTGTDLPAYAFADAYLPISYIIVEDVKVEEDTEITVDLSEATNFIQFKPMNNDGEPFKVPLLIIDETAQTMEWDYSNANVTDVIFNTCFYDNVAGKYLDYYFGNYSHVREDGRSYGDQASFYIKLSATSTRFIKI